MEWLLAITLGSMALFYICQPLFAGAGAARRQSKFESWHSLEQLEFDRELGKIDEDELEELKGRVPLEPPKTDDSQPGSRGFSIESLILGARRRKKMHLTLETEILIARARQSTRKANDRK